MDYQTEFDFGRKKKILKKPKQTLQILGKYKILLREWITKRILILRERKQFWENQKQILPNIFGV